MRPQWPRRAARDASVGQKLPDAAPLLYCQSRRHDSSTSGRVAETGPFKRDLRDFKRRALPAADLCMCVTEILPCGVTLFASRGGAHGGRWYDVVASVRSRSAGWKHAPNGENAAWHGLLGNEYV